MPTEPITTTEPVSLTDRVKLQVDASKHLSTVAAVAIGFASWSYAVIKPLPHPYFFLLPFICFLISFGFSTFSLVLPWWLDDDPGMTIKKDRKKARNLFGIGLAAFVAGVGAIAFAMLNNVPLPHA